MPSTFVYDSGVTREDLTDLLINLSPTETQLISGLASTTAKAIRHENPIDTLATAAFNGFVDGVDASYPATSNPTVMYNYVQNFRRGVSVTDEERAVDQAGFDDRFEYEKMKKLKELKNDMEFSILRGSLASGTGSAIRQMRGLKLSLSLITSQSGVSLTEKALNDYFQLVWDNTGTQVNAVYGSMYIKRKISGFTAGTTKNTKVEDRRLINAVDVYEADAASMVKLFAHRYVTVSGDTNYDILGIDESLFKIAYLTNPYYEDRAKTGTSSKGENICNCTLEVGHYNAGFWGKAHL